MQTYLIIANKTLFSEDLLREVAERLAAGPARFYVVIPATPIQGALTWDEAQTWRAAEGRLAEILGWFHDRGVEAEGEVGDRDPVAAARDALRRRVVDEIILSTLPAGVSRWLGQDVPSRLRGDVSVPVKVVIQTPQPAESSRH